MTDPRRPVLTFDLDGVICRPPLGINPGRGQRKSREGMGTKNLLWLTERWRYLGRKPMPGARNGLRALAASFDCQVVSARSDAAGALTETWFRRNIGFEPPLNLRPDWRERPAQFKVRRIVELGAFAHFEDDAHTAQWVAELLPAVFLVDWWRNRWLEGPNIHRIRRIDDAIPVLDRLLREAQSPAGANG
ncbi:MAG: hypothetical protein C0506_14480 [Anaerolinea sp.]|nr:hypothetical protein [Anaerolinea sp.]